MPRITGLIDANNLMNGTLQIKPNQAFLGATTTIMEFPIVDGKIDITIPATSHDVVYLIGLKSDTGFKPLEQWTVPVEDCTVSQIRNISLSHINRLEKENKTFKEQIYKLISQISDINNELLSVSQVNRTVEEKLTTEQKKTSDYIKEIEILNNKIKELKLQIEELKNPSRLPPPNQKQKITPADVTANLLRSVT